MLTAEPVNYRGTVLLCDFADVRPAGEMTTSPLLYNERQSISLLVSRHGGQTMESSVRNYIALFPQAENALTAARQILREVIHWRNTDPNRRGLTCRLILGYGQVTVDKGRMRSEWTHKLSGLVSQVPEYDIAALPELIEHLRLEPPPPAYKAGSSNQMLYKIGNIDKGSSPDDHATDRAQTRHAPSLQSADTGVFTEINLTVGGKRRVVKMSECPLNVGRESTCGVVLSGDMVSRVHGSISYENGKFFYTDNSRNGSFVLTASGEEVFVRGERLPLIGQGAISPGAPLATQKGQVLRYSCTSSKLSMAGERNGDTRTLER